MLIKRCSSHINEGGALANRNDYIVAWRLSEQGYEQGMAASIQIWSVHLGYLTGG